MNDNISDKNRYFLSWNNVITKELYSDNDYIKSYKNILRNLSNENEFSFSTIEEEKDINKIQIKFSSECRRKLHSYKSQIEYECMDFYKQVKKNSSELFNLSFIDINHNRVYLPEESYTVPYLIRKFTEDDSLLTELCEIKKIKKYYMIVMLYYLVSENQKFIKNNGNLIFKTTELYHKDIITKLKIFKI